MATKIEWSNGSEFARASNGWEAEQKGSRYAVYNAQGLCVSMTMTATEVERAMLDETPEITV